MENVFQRRQTAYKLWIKDILNSNFIKGDSESRQNYIILKEKQISRVNIVATVVNTLKNKDTEKQYSSLTIDDSSGQIRIKAWDENTEILENINISDTILIIGRIREYNEEIYIVPEIVKKVDSLWEIERRLELTNEFGVNELNIDYENSEVKKIIIQKADSAKEFNTALITEEKIEEPKEPPEVKIIKLIEKLDKEDGASIIDIIKESKMNEEEANKVIEELIKQGEIYQIKQGKLKTT